MEVSSERLILKPLNEGDEDEMLKIRSHPEINRYIGRKPPSNIDEIRAFIKKIHKATEEGATLFWTIRQSHAEEIMGTICLWNIDRKHERAEIGYELLPEYQGKGFMTEAIEVILDYGFGVQHFKEISAYTNKANAASIQLLKKHGFRHHPDIKDVDFPDNKVFIKHHQL